MRSPSAFPRFFLFALLIASVPLQATDAENYGKLPLAFQQNVGQTDAQVKFLGSSSEQTLFFTQREVVMRLPRAVLRMSFIGSGQPTVSGSESLPGSANYFLGNDPRRWRSGVPSYARVRYHQVYPGIDVAYYGNQRQLEYDILVAASADPSRIRPATPISPARLSLSISPRWPPFN